MIPLRRIDSEVIHFGRTNHQPDNAELTAGQARELATALIAAADEAERLPPVNKRRPPCRSRRSAASIHAR
jgi:hypothetical protein